MNRTGLFICILLMLFNSFSAIAQEEGLLYNAADENEAAVLFLNDIGIWDNSLKTDDTLTRAEFVKIAANMIGDKTVISKPDKASFLDVNENHEAFLEIEYLTGLGILNGFDKNFYPDSEIKAEEVIKVLILIAGYEIYAENSGGYPSGYFFTAQKYGLLKNISLNGECKRGQTARLVKNTLELKKLNITSIKDEELSYSFGNTLLWENLNIKKVIGTVQANYYTGLYETERTVENQVIIDGIKYKTGTTNAADFLGFKLTFYARVSKYDGADITIVSIEDYKKHNGLTVIDAYDLDKASTTLNKISYYKDGDRNKKRLEIPVKASVCVVHNTTMLTDFALSDLTPDIGEIRLLDNDTDGNTDIIFVTSYETYLVDSIMGYSSEIRDTKNNKTISLDDGANKIINIYKSGSAVNFEAIKRNDIISVAQGEGIINVIISSLSFDGFVESCDDDFVTVNGQVYKPAPNLSDKLEAGDSGVFYFDFAERLVYFEPVTGGFLKYGYLMDVHKKQGLDNKVLFKIFDDTGKTVVLSSADKIIFTNGTVMGEYGEITEKPVEPDSILNDSGIKREGIVLRQIVKYGVNGAGELKNLMLAKEGSEVTTSEKKQLFTADFDGSFSIQGSTVKMADGKYLINDDTKVFVFVENDSDDEKLMVMDGSSILRDSTYVLKGYDLDSDNIAAAILMTSNGQPGSYDDIMVVKKVVKAVNEEGESIIKVHGYVLGKEVILTASDDLADITNWAAKDRKILQLLEGEVIQYTIRQDNIIKSFRTLYSHSPANLYFGGYFEGRSQTNPDTIYQYTNATQNGYGVMYIAKAKIYNIGTKMISINAYGSKEDSPEEPQYPVADRVCSIDTASIFVYNNSTGALSVGNTNDLALGSDIFIRIYANQGRDIIVFRN